jgi:hypothetical protein
MTAFKFMCQISKSDIVSGVCREDVSKSLAYQKKHPIRAALLYVVYCNNEPTYNRAINLHINSLLSKATTIEAGMPTFVPRDVPIKCGKDAIELVKKSKDIIEGLVLVDTTAGLEVTMNGKPNRCATWKIKSRGDCDVIADGYTEGKGKFQGKIGSIKICQYDKEGNRVDLGNVGGFEACDRNINDWTFPCVVEIKYDQRFPDTGKFQFGVFSKVHEDKLIEYVELFKGK